MVTWSYIQGSIPETDRSSVVHVTRGLLKNHLIVHLAVHDNVKRFRCDVCDKGFTQKVSLTTHMKKHAGAQPH